MKLYDVIIIGGGQSALACAYFLRKSNLDYIILDDQETCGGSWLKAWDSLTLFSPANTSSLPGWMMPETKEEYPSKKEVIAYLCTYEQKYEVNVKRPVEVIAINKITEGFEVKAQHEVYYSKTIIAATGTWKAPYNPDIEGKETFKGIQLHTAYYTNAQPHIGKKVLVVGEGNSGAQIYAELSAATQTVWSTLKPPAFLPDDVTGHTLFNVATAKYHAQKEGKPFDAANYNLGNIVMVPPVKAARDRGVLHSKGQFVAMYEEGVIWEDVTKEAFDVIIWCTGFKPATNFLTPLGIVEQDGKVKTTGTKAINAEGLWLVGYGSWTGFASATLIGVGRSARETIKEITHFINNN